VLAFTSYGASQISTSSITIDCATTLFAYAQINWGSSSVSENATGIYSSALSHSIVIGNLLPGTTYYFKIICNTSYNVQGPGNIKSAILSFSTLSIPLALLPDSFSNLYNWYKGGLESSEDGSFVGSGDSTELWYDLTNAGGLTGFSNIARYNGYNNSDTPLLLNNHYIFQNINTAFLSSWQPLKGSTTQLVFTITCAFKCDGTNSGGLLHWSGNMETTRSYFKLIYDGSSLIVTLQDMYSHTMVISKLIDMSSKFQIISVTFSGTILILYIDGTSISTTNADFSTTGFTGLFGLLGNISTNLNAISPATPPTYFSCPEIVIYNEAKPKSVINFINQYIANRYNIVYLPIS
jgi:hypothetical protein